MPDALKAETFRCFAVLPNRIFLGTDKGVRVTAVEGLPPDMVFLPSWFAINGGIPAVNVLDMEYNALANVLAIATLGRSAYVIKNANSFSIAKRSQIANR
jgi:hypothetical protein